MSFASHLVHSLAIVTPTTDGTLDEHGQPVAGEPIVTLVNGLIQPKSAREVAQANQAGAMIADHVIFLERQTLSNDAFVRFEPDDGDRYEISGIRLYNFGRSPHLEVDARRIASSALAAEAS